MRKFISLSSFCILVLSSNAQSLLPVYHDTIPNKRELILTGIGAYGSNGILNEMSNKLLFGGVITDQMKQDAFQKHWDNPQLNKVGLDVQGEFEFRNTTSNLFKNEKWGFGLKAGYYMNASALYQKDLFGVAFLGNESYMGKIANFSGSGAALYGFQKIGFSAIEKETGSIFSLNFVNLSNYARAEINKGGVFQTALGDTLNLAMTGSYTSSASNNFSKGYGFAIDADIRLQLQHSKTNRITHVQVLFKNVGIVRLNPEFSTKRIDTIYNTSGFTFQELLNLKTLDSLSLFQKEGANYTTLPGLIQIAKLVNPNDQRKFQAYYGLRLYYKNYFTYVYAGLDYKVNSYVHVGMNGSYGGFSKWQTGLYGQFNFGSWNIGLATENTIALFSKKAFGESISIRLRCVF